MDRRQKRSLIRQLEADAERIARHFGLRYRAIEAERANVTSRYGVCYSDGTIRIRLNHATSGRALKYSSLVATLCHELAHLRYFDHSKRFQRFNRDVLEWSRQQGIYQPGARRGATPVPTPRVAEAPRPQQLDLFD